MFRKIIVKDIKRSKLISIALVLFVAAAAALVSAAAVTTVNLMGSIDTLMKQAESPHFMQMHSGELDLQRLAEFADNQALVERWQVLEFLNVDNARISFGEKSLADSVQDNGVTVQSKKFDYLLDLDGNIIRVQPGEIYLPICYRHMGTVGDTMTINDIPFTIAGYLRDSQMNSSFAASKRFLVNEKDYAIVEQNGSTEYLIEFRLYDMATIGELEAAYTKAGLEANGPAVTYPLFRMINALSDGIMIAILLLVSLLMIAIAFLCIRLTLLTKIEDDYREIGIMKAIGLSNQDIRRVYLGKYITIAGIGCLLGLLTMLLFHNALLQNIRLTMGESKNQVPAYLFGVLGVISIFLLVIVYVRGILKRFRRISPAAAIRSGYADNTAGKSGRVKLSHSTWINANVYLGMKDVITRPKLYLTMVIILTLAAFIIIVPQNLYSTISSKSFMTYMGVGECDMRFDLQQLEDVDEKAQEILTSLMQDGEVSKAAVYETHTYSTINAEGNLENIKVELGDSSTFPISYQAGRAPEREDELALSTLNAQELGKGIGDRIILIRKNSERTMTVCGIYSDITNGGKTAKAVFQSSSKNAMWYIINVDLVNGTAVQEKVDSYSHLFPGVKVSSISDYIAQTMGGGIKSMKYASAFAMVAAVFISILVTALFMKMLIAKDSYPIAVMKGLGFTDNDVTKQYITRAIIVLAIGVLLGAILSNTLGEILAGLLLSMLGAGRLNFIIDPVKAYLLCPLILTGGVLIATFLSTASAGRINIINHAKEN
jgi:putative ABC transport system permease protein